MQNTLLKAMVRLVSLAQQYLVCRIYNILMGYYKEQEAFLCNKPVAFSLLWKAITGPGTAVTTSTLNPPEQLQPSGTKEPKAKVRRRTGSLSFKEGSLHDSLLEDFVVHPP